MSMQDIFGGIGGIAQTINFGQQVGFSNELMSWYRQQQQYIPSPICVHGSDCPKCKENEEVAIKYRKEQEGKIATKKAFYQNRCVEWMDRLHNIRRTHGSV